jgi:hypothetical protein
LPHPLLPADSLYQFTTPANSFLSEAFKVKLDILVNGLHVAHNIPAGNIIQMLHIKKKEQISKQMTHLSEKITFKDIKTEKIYTNRASFHRELSHLLYKEMGSLALR